MGLLAGCALVLPAALHGAAPGPVYSYGPDQVAFPAVRPASCSSIRASISSTAVTSMIPAPFLASPQAARVYL